MKGLFKAQEELQELKKEYVTFKNKCEIKEKHFKQKINEATKKCNIIVSGIDFEEVSKAKEILYVSYNIDDVAEIPFLAKKVIKNLLKILVFSKAIICTQKYMQN